MPSPVQLGHKAWATIWFVVVSALMGLLVSGLFIPFAAMAGVTAKVGADTMNSLPADLETPPLMQGSKIEMADGTQIATIYDEDRTYVPLDQISKVMQQAQVAIEDNRFYEHGALDFRGTMRALFTSSGAQGGSTITQQYVKNVQIQNAIASGDQQAEQKAQERTLARKVQELRYGIAMEKRFSKDQILERYLNIANYGGQEYGVEAAAHHYFNKHASELTLPEAAMIAGIVQNPSQFNPELHQEAATNRRNTVLARMLQLNIITQKQYDDAVATKFDPNNIQALRNGCVGADYSQICQYAVNELYNETPSLGNNKEDRENMVSRGALTIKLTVDPKIQDIAQTELNKEISPTDAVISTFAMVKPGTGKILAMAQSRPTFGGDAASGQTFWNYNADYGMGGAQGYQAGSTFKIFNSANALDMGVPPTKTFVATSGLQYKGKTFVSCDGPFTLADDYHPQNDKGEQYGAVDMYKAAQLSINSYYLQLEQSTSICGLAKMADAAGVHVQNPNGPQLTMAGNFSTNPSITLGSVEVSPLSMANAYATFAARGKRCDNSIVGSITSRDGKPVATKPDNCQQVIKPEVADAVNAVFSTVVTDPGGSGHATLVPGYDQAGKTGTTDTSGTVWYDGYTPDFAASSMVTVDTTNSYWTNRQPNLTGYYPKTGYRSSFDGGGLSGFGSPDCTDFFRQIWKQVLPTGPNSKFNKPPDSIMKGKQVAVPAITGRDPNADEATLKAAGFTTARINVASNYAKGTYLGIDKQVGSQQTTGSLINLMFSAGPGAAGTQPTSQPSR